MREISKNRLKNISVLIADELNTTLGGVYKIIFENTGQFYVGVSSGLRRRVMSHLSNFRTGFKKCSSLRRMAFYEGVIRFELIKICSTCEEMLDIERTILCKNIFNRKLLNRTAHVGKRQRKY